MGRWRDAEAPQGCNVHRGKATGNREEARPLQALERGLTRNLILTPSLQSCEQINVCCASYALCSIVLRQPGETDTHPCTEKVC